MKRGIAQSLIIILITCNDSLFQGRAKALFCGATRATFLKGVYPLP